MKRRYLLIVPMVTLLIGGYAGYSWWQSPAEVTPVQMTPTNVLGSETTLKDWSTAYFTSRYPANMLVKSVSENALKSVVGSYLLSGTGRQSADQVGVTVGVLGSSNIEDSSAVKFRRNNPADYTLVSRNYAPAGAVTFSRQSGDFETGMFWPRGNQYVAVVVSGSSARQAELEQALSSIVTNWQWK